MKESREQHTRGPWEIHEGCGTAVEPHQIRGSGGAIVATTYWDRFVMDDSDEPEANARLIAAAPDYHSEAVALVTRHDAKAQRANFARCGCEDCTPFRAAIAKATGTEVAR